MAAASGELVEHRTIQAIPPDERYGRPRDLFTMWFAANVHPLALVTGALAPSVFGLSFVWSLAAIVAGLVAGGLLMSLHSAQGPQLGLPQMIQSRGQFGGYGALLLVLITILMYLGFFSSTIVVGGQAFELVIPQLGAHGGVIIATAVGVVVAALGYEMIHRMGKLVTVVSGALMIVGGAWLLFSGSHRHTILSGGGFSLKGFLAVTSIAAIWLAAYSPYVSDYSRYMPATFASVKSTFWTTYVGAVLGTLIPMVVGVGLGRLVGDGDVLAGTKGIFGSAFGTIFLLGTGLVLVHVNAMNLYGSVLCLVTTGQTFRPNWFPAARARLVLAICVAVAALTLALVMSSNFFDGFLTFINVLTYVMIPWSAINLVDFYLIRRGHYDLDSLLSADGGQYGRFRGPAFVAYFAALVAQLPFAAMTFYTGPIAKAMGGIDIAWLVGFVVAVPMYLYTARRAGWIGKNIKILASLRTPALEDLSNK